MKNLFVKLDSHTALYVTDAAAQGVGKAYGVGVQFTVQTVSS